MGKNCNWKSEGKYRLGGTYKVIPVQAVKAYRRSRSIAPVIHKLSTRWR
jgi:hypothetical protein